jgi:hypothetical protein
MSSIAIVGLGRVFETAIAFVQHLQLGISDLPGCILIFWFFSNSISDLMVLNWC